jgi:hypothetical protein
MKTLSNLLQRHISVIAKSEYSKVLITGKVFGASLFFVERVSKGGIERIK